MIVPFDERIKSDKLNLVDSDNKTLINFGLTPLIYPTKPLFILPNGQIYFDNIFIHVNANILKTVRDYMLKIYDVDCGAYLKTPLSIEQKLIKDYENLMNEKFRLSSSKLVMGIDVTNYLNYNPDIFSFANHNYNFDYCNTQNIFNNNAHSIIMGIIESKIIINRFFYNLLQSSPNPIEALDSLKKYISKLEFYWYEKSFEKAFGMQATRPNLMITNDFIIEILVVLMGFDKIETQVNKTITTSNQHNIHERFYNYLIMEYNVTKIPQLVYNYATNEFIVHTNEFIQLGNDISYEEEIKLIKRKVPYQDRHKYFL